MHRQKIPVRNNLRTGKTQNQQPLQESNLLLRSQIPGCCLYTKGLLFVAQAGVEPTARAYETRMLPLHHRAKSVRTVGLEPTATGLQPAALPIGATSPSFDVLVFWCFSRLRAPYNAVSLARPSLAVHRLSLAGAAGFEPATFGFGDQRYCPLSYTPVIFVLPTGLEPASPA